MPVMQFSITPHLPPKKFGTKRSNTNLPLSKAHGLQPTVKQTSRIIFMKYATFSLFQIID